MKVKFSKKLLSVILAALMVVTSIPIIAISTSAATNSGEREVTGVVTIDPVIYLHGAYGGSTTSEYAYMMNGDTIADGTVEGEKSTAFQSTKNVTTITVVDSGAILSTTNGKLSGSLGGDYGSVTTSTTSKYATLKFKFSDGTVEYHKLAVKANPVAQHAVAMGQAWNGAGGSYVRIVNFEMLAVGSYGQEVDGSVTFGSDEGWPGTSDRQNGRYNYPSMYTPNNSNYAAGDHSIVGLTTGQISVDKTVGYYGMHMTGRAIGNSTGSVRVSPATAIYYLDKSTDKNEGITYNPGDNTYSFKMFLGSLYNTKVVTQPIEKMENSISGTGFTYVNDAILDQKSAFVSNTGNTGYATITGSASTTGDQTGVYTIGYYYAKSLEGASSNGPERAEAVISMPFTVKVVDKSSLRDVYNEYITLDLDSRCYTADSWETYKNALLTAESYLNDYQTYDSSLQTTYVNALKLAKAGLVQIEDNTDAIHSFTITKVVDPTCTDQGYTSHTCDRCGYTYNDSYVDATGHQYVYTPVDGEYNHTVSCELGDLQEYTEACVDNNGDGECDKCHQSLLASWAKYDAQLRELRTALQGTDDKKLSAEKLAQLQPYFNVDTTPLTYYKKYISDQKDTVTASEQKALDNEADYLAGLMPKETDYIYIDAALATTMNDDADQYDPQVIEDLKANLTEEVQIGVSTYSGVDYANQDALDLAVQDALEASMQYNVYVNEVNVGTFNYGEVVTVDGTGKVITDGTTPTDEKFAWTGCYGAPSLGTNDADPEVEYNTSEEKYLTNDSTYTFVVKGDTYLTAVDSQADESISMVTIVNSVTGFISDIFYVNTGDTIGSKLAENEKNIAFYKFDGFFDARSGGNAVTADTAVNDDMIVYACYSVNRDRSYDVAAYGSYNGFYNGEEAIIADPDNSYNPVQYKYNDRIDLATDLDDFYAWVKVVDINEFEPYTVEVVSYDRDYSFYVCEDAYLFPITKAEAENGLDSNCVIVNYDADNFDAATDNVQIFAKKELIPIYTSDDTFEKFSMIGSYAVPEGYTVLEKGFLINTDSSVDVTDEDFVVTNESLNRIKVIHLTDGNQFVLNVKGVAPTSPVDYRAYAVVEAPDGTRTEIYSNIVTEATAE